MKDDKLVSIIVPVYNSEKSLERCLDSILGQTYKKIEIILVNDGSTDSSVEICKEYETIDSRIQLISIENSGVANARNKGIDIATGDYISFVDSDDAIDENFINIMYHSCVKYNAKICAVNVNYCYGNKIKRPIRMQNCVVESDKYYELLLNSIKGFVCNKLYHKSLLKDVRFDEDIAIGEDLLFNVRTAHKIDRAVIVNEYLYNYFQNNHTAYNSKYNMKKISEIYAYDRIIDIVEKKCNNALKEYKCEYLIMAINQKNQYKNSDLKNTEIYTMIMTSMNKYYNEVMKSDEIPIIKKIYIILLDKCYKFIRLLKFIKNRVI